VVESASVTADDDPRVAVVGAGITGLALTHHLAERGVPAVTLEASDDPGGVLRSETVDGHVLELGPQRLRLSPPVGELVRAADLDDEVVRAPGDAPLWMYVDGRPRRVPLSPTTAVTTELLSWRGKLRAALEPLTAGPREGESVGGAVRRMVGHEAAERWLLPLFAGLYGSEPDAMPVEHSLLPALRKRGIDRSIALAAARRALRGGDLPPIVSFESGLGALPGRLYERYADRVRLSTPVRSVRRDDAGTDAADGGERGETGDEAGATRWRVETDDGALVVDEVVLTTPADVTSAVLADADPASAAALRELRYNPVAHVYLRSDHEATGVGCKVPRSEGLRIDGVTYTASLFDREVYTVAMGGDDDLGVRTDDDATLIDAALEGFEAVTGATAAPVAVHRWPRGIPARDDSFDALERVDLPAGLHLATNYTARTGVPGRVRQARRVADGLAERVGRTADGRADRARLAPNRE